MSVRMRHTKGHSGNRRSHHALAGVKAVKNPDTGVLSLPHRVDESTGMYRGRQIFAPKVKTKLSADTQAKVHSHTHGNDIQGSKGVVGKIASAARPRSRSGMGGGA